MMIVLPSNPVLSVAPPSRSRSCTMRVLALPSLLTFLLFLSPALGQVQQFNIAFQVAEDAPVGTFVGIVEGDGYSPPYDRLITYPTDNKTSSFEIFLQNGEVRTKELLDREDRETHTLIISTLAPTKLVIVTIRILDINDITPTFISPNNTFSIPETAPRTHNIALGSVRDEDLGENSTQTVEIIKGNEDNTFYLKIKNSSNVDKILDLVVNTDHLDYEHIKVYNLVIRATDGGGRYSDLSVTINILDENDNEPIFNTSKYSARIAENVTVGTSIIQVEATDRDSVKNNQITYSINPSSDPKEYFYIDPVTGWVMVNKPLDYETQSQFTLTLEARDNGVTPQKGTAALDVILEDINEQPANISLVFRPEFRSGHVREDTPINTVIAEISIDDPDKDASRKVEVLLYGHRGYFNISERDQDHKVTLSIIKSLDRELYPDYKMTIDVTDVGTPPLRANLVFTVTIDDVNDNPPVFNPTTYTASVEETAEVGKEVIKVSAEDKDFGENARITYRLQESSSHLGWFTVDPQTGVVSTRATLDCELSAEPVLVIVATDGGNPPLMATAQVTVSVRDVNNKEPEFETSFYSIKIAEDRRVGDCILTVSAIDPECGSNSPVTYKMARMLEPLQEFRVDNKTGEICVKNQLDFERASNYQFQVEAVDTDGLSTQAVVQVDVTDINDNHPKFEPNRYPINVVADTRPGPVVTVQARDLDSGVFGTVNYSIISGNEGNLFSVDPVTGAVSLINPLPVGAQDFKIRIKATDGGGLTSAEPALVEVSVIGDNDHPPVFSPTMFNFTMFEDVGPGEKVGEVQATLDQMQAGKEIRYSTTFQTADWFRIDQLTGAIYSKSAVDREAHPFVVLSVQAEVGFPPLYAVAQVNITILDVNDNYPTFPATTMLELEVREDEAVGSVLYEARAHDSDIGNNGEIRYRLENSPSGLFSINLVSGELKLDSHLDYEHHKDYELLIVASDMGSPSLSSTMTLTINVKDVNDNTPEFIDDQPYLFNVPENVNIGHTVGVVVARDDDSEHNGRISYSFVDNRYDSVFGISRVTGTIWTRDYLDRELHDVYELRVMAIDHGSTVQLSSTTSVTIVVTDVNDNKPEFTRDEYRFFIKENLNRNTVVGQVVAYDDDIGENGRLKYGFASSQKIFLIDPRTGVIRTQEPLDREKFPEHVLTVFVSDGGEEPQTAVVKITVEDVNDNDPVFQRRGPVTASVHENRPKGIEVIQMVAYDPDEGDNGLITYYFDQVNSQAAALDNFDIHPRSGKVTTREVLDYESRTSYQLTVVAEDNGKEKRKTSEILTISVLDANDQAPLFHSRHVTFDCVENVSVGTVVGQVVATDLDSGDNGRVNYYLVGGNVFSSFAVNRSTGVITTVREIDYEESSFHTLSIQAGDQSAALPLSSNITVTINVLDVNDNAPSFEQDPVIIRTVEENTPRGHSIHQFIATDRDSDVNGTVQYSIESYSGQQEGLGPYFRIEPNTGHLLVDGLIDYEQVDQISVIVKAQDMCPYPNLALHSLITTLVYVTDVNDNAPVFDSVDSLTVSEDEPFGSMLLVVVAVDADSDVDGSGNNQVRYKIVDGNQDGKFVLGEDTGYLTLADTLDYEATKSYSLNISAEDSGTPSRTSYQTLVISVADVNDNAPIFDRPVYEASVYENSQPQTSVVTIRARDDDTGANGELRYSIPGGIAEDRFAVDAKTGEVTTRARLDREDKDSYVVTVYVKDNAYPIHLSSCTIIITVLDRNDNSPEFKLDTYSIQIPENRAQLDVLTLVASDKDLGDNARITYSIVDGNDGKFRIDRQLGHLSCQALDRETTSSYRLIIRARDNGVEPQVATATVLVTVLDENDNSPTFSKSVYQGSIPENIQQGEVVLKVNATDPDQLLNGQVMYSLGNDTEGYFEIDSVTGEVITSGVFDREKISSFSFLIMASDNGITGPRNTTARVDIEITDVNDNAPVFTMVPYTSSLSLSTGENKSILTVSALDSDADLNGKVTYSLLANPGYSRSLEYFRIDATSGILYTKKPMMTASGHHSLLVVATDSAVDPSPQFSSTGVIEITVGSVGSQQFHFTKSEYSVEIDEHLADGSFVAEVTAVYDPEIFPRDTTVYSFASGNENEAFRINPTTGKVTVHKSQLLDYDTKPQIRLTVKAVDNNNQTYVTLWVNMRDINDNAPKFSQSRYVSAIWENNQPETFVTQVIARDADSGLNGEIDYFIVGGNDEQNFKIDPPRTGIVHTNIDAAPLDREARAGGYSLTIEARDHGNPPKSSTCTLVITIVDENDSPPYFPHIPPQNVSENRDVGYMVAMATANDVDLNPILVYDFTTDGNPDKSFSIDRSTGRLTLAKRLDHEKKSHYSVGIQVMDGKPDHTQYKWIDVYVTDENDNAPQFTQQSYEVALPEQTGPQKSVARVLATDADSGRNAEITYSMAATPMDSFYINPSTGVIYTNKTITFTPGESIIQLVVIARDAGTPILSSMVAVHIQITDVNKHAPRFLSPTGYQALLSESAQRGHMVLEVKAIDDDDTHRAAESIHYSLQGFYKDFFHIQQRTGQIFYNGGADYEKMKQFDLIAVATDRGTPPKNATAAVMIFVRDENDNAPEFVEDHYTVELPEDYPALKEFIRVNATDKDSGLNGELKYHITSGNSEGIFLNPGHEGGLVIMQGMSLDYESHTSHRLILRVIDCSRCNNTSARLSAFVTVDILVTDVNEFKPRFPVKHYYEDIAENSPPGSIVFRAHANDADTGDAGIVSYSIIDELDSSKFNISKTTGDVTALITFDYEQPNTPHLYNITIMATDSGGNFDRASVTIRVVDMDEFKPLLSAAEYKFEVPGSAKAGDFVGQVLASDRDTGEAGQLYFTFLEPNEYFHIHPSSGNITVAVTLHENPPAHHVERSRKRRALTSDMVTLTIQVSSGKPGSKVDTAQCTVDIDRSCEGCAAPVEELRASSSMDGGVLAGIIVGCVLFIVIAVAIIIFFAYRRRSPRKSVPNYSSDSTLDLEPPPTLPHDRAYHDVIRISRPQPSNHVASDISDQSHNSASSGRGSAEAEDDDEEISRINSNSFLHSSQAFRQKAMPDSGIQHDDDTLSEPTATTHQEYLANLGIDSAKIGKTKSSTKQLGRSAESMHQFSDEGGGEGGVDTDFEKMTDLETDDEVATLEARTQGLSFHEPDTHNVGSLSSVVNSEEVNSGSYNWDYLIDWGPQYQPLAHVFSEIAKLKDESITPKKQPVKTVPQRQFSSSLKPQVRTDPPPIITNAPPMSVPLTAGQMSNNQNGEAIDFVHQSPPVRRGHQPPQQQLLHNHQHHNHPHHHHHPHHLQQQQVRASHGPMSQPAPPAYNSLAPQYTPGIYPQQGHQHSPQPPLRHHPNHQSPKHLQQHHHHHLPPPSYPPPQPPTQQQQSSSGSRSQPVSGHASTMNTSLPSLPRSPISYESSLTSAAMTPSLTPSLSPLATRSPSISPVVSSGHTTPGKSSSRQNLTKRSTHSTSSNSEKEFTI